MDKGVVREKYNGLCAYTGTPLGEDWQVDHYLPKRYCQLKMIDPNTFDNLVPCQRIINHYKSALLPDTFRKRIATLHERLAKLPKNPRVGYTIRHKEYLWEVADLFGITEDTPFCGYFYFEKLDQ